MSRNIRDVEAALARLIYDPEEEGQTFDEFYGDYNGDDYFYGFSGSWDGVEGELREINNYVPGLGHVIVVEDHGGEGQGDDRWLVFQVTGEGDDVTFYKKNGYWVSHEGSTWDGEFEEVNVVQRMVTFYE